MKEFFRQIYKTAFVSEQYKSILEIPVLGEYNFFLEISVLLNIKHFRSFYETREC